ncbi:MAG: chitobiase/beta-hexosaminidase C-terminal domain-containing protein [Bacteroidales bacterium]|nr:chitobiase/beta-hexosaminidase C-terminal domain-containing protein [Bacteroidales bacterium]
MFAKNKSLKTLMLKISSIITLCFISISLIAQTDTIPSFYKDSTGKLFVATGSHVYLYVGITPDGSKSFRLKGDNGNQPLHWSGHGLKQLTHLNLFLGRTVSLDLFADALPPKTSIKYESGKDIQKDNTTYLSGQCIIELSAIDPDAGLKEIFYSINGEANTKYIEPISLKSEGSYRFSVFSIDNVGNTENIATHNIVVDNTPPQSQLDFNGDIFENIVSGRSSLTISSIDANEVKQTFFSIDSSKMTPYIKPIKTSTLSEGEHTINWYSVDEVDNAELVKSFVFYVDKTPPLVFEEVAGNTYILAGKEYSSGRSQLKIASVDNKAGVKGIYYSLNGSEFKQYDKPVYLSDIIGTVSLRSYAIDNVGNKSISDSQSEVFTMPTVDITGPQIYYNFGEPKISLKDTVWIGPKTKIAIKISDTGAGVNRVNYKIKGRNEKLYTEPFTIDTLGIQNILCTAYDNVDNVNLISFTFGVDNKAPIIYYHYSIEPIGFLNENGESIPIFSKGLKLYLAATDNISGVDRLTYTLNNTNEVKYNSPIEKFKSNTTYTLLIKSIDALGNNSEKTIKFRVE